MKGKIRQYRPAYVSGIDTFSGSYSTLDELLNIDWVKSFNTRVDGKEFHRYSIAQYPNRMSECQLIAEYSEGKVWYVIGICDNNDIVKQLPVWEPKY